jgi:hypothetical protein
LSARPAKLAYSAGPEYTKNLILFLQNAYLCGNFNLISSPGLQTSQLRANPGLGLEFRSETV